MSSYSVEQIIDTMLGYGASGVLMALAAIVAGIGVIHLGLFLVTWYIQFRDAQQKLNRETEAYLEKLKRFDVTLPEQDYVVGIGDDGELVYASEKPKNDEES